MPISPDIIETIRQHNNIVEVVSQYIRLKRVGKNYRSLCPFHNERTPSFYVSPERQLFRCFGCNTAGNVFHFLMKMEGISFPEAVKKLARRSGIALPRQEDSAKINAETRHRQKLFAVNNLFAEYCQRNLLGFRPAKKYLARRRVSETIIEKFKLGWCGASAEPIIKLATKENYPPELLAENGIISKRQTGNWSIPLSNRIIFPIFDAQGRIIGFGGRVLDDRLPKYLNSPDTLLYHKSKSLYGLYQAIPSLRRTGQAIVCEGYLDVLTCHQCGLENTVASLGTAFGEEQVLILKRYVETAIILYDTDRGGEEGALRGLDRLSGSGLHIKAAILPAGTDPDEFLKQRGVEEFRQVLQAALPLVDYRLQLALRGKDLSRVEDKLAVVKQVLPAVAGLENLVERREEIKKLSKSLDVNQNDLWLECQKLKSRGPAWTLSPRLVGVGLKSEQGIQSAEEQLLQAILNKPEFIPRVTEQLPIEDFKSAPVKQAMETIFHYWSGNQTRPPASLGAEILNYLPEEKVSNLLARLSFDREQGGQQKRIPTRELVDSLVRSIKTAHLKRKYEAVAKDIQQRLETEQDVPPEKLTEYKHLTSLLKGSSQIK